LQAGGGVENSCTFCGTRRPPSAILGSVSEPNIIQGRRVDAAQVEQIRQLLAGHPDWGRSHLSRHLALLWDWRNGAGRLKDMAARTLLLKLERRGWIALPPRRHPPGNRMAQKPVRTTPEAGGMQPTFSGALESVLPLQLHEVSAGAAPAQRRLFEQLLRRHHYLSYRGTVGENLQYLASTRQGQTLACVLFGAPAWQCAPRDAYIGWEAPNRCRGLHLIANNTRFLVVPWAEVPSSTPCTGTFANGCKASPTPTPQIRSHYEEHSHCD
jgi:Druantia protein DruA